MAEKKPTRKISRYMLILFLLMASILWPLVVNQPFLQQLMFMVFLCATIATGWNIISGYYRQVSPGHVFFFGIGAYATTLLVQRIGLSPWGGICATVCVSLFLATLIGFLCFKLAGHYFVIATSAANDETIRPPVINRDWLGSARAPPHSLASMKATTLVQVGVTFGLGIRLPSGT